MINDANKVLNEVKINPIAYPKSTPKIYYTKHLQLY